MTSIKCAQCGFVSSSQNETCKSCGASFTNPSARRPRKAGRNYTKVAIALGTGVVVLALGLLVVSTLTSTVVSARTPSPSEAAALLSAYEAVNRPVTITLPTELKQTVQSGTLNEDALLQNYLLGRVLRDLGLITVDFTVVKANERQCYRYDYDYSRPVPSAEYGVHQYYVIRNPNGALEQCDDVWNYTTTIKPVDPAIADKTSVNQKAQTLTDINDTLPRGSRTAAVPEGSGDSTTFSLGSLEIVEVSDLVAGTQPGTYTLGFKYRLKGTTLGEVFDAASSIHKAMPPGVRRIFADPQLDNRLTNTGKLMDDGLRFGHAVLALEGSIIRQWRITQVQFDSRDTTNYTFHQVE